MPIDEIPTPLTFTHNPNRLPPLEQWVDTRTDMHVYRNITKVERITLNPGHFVQNSPNKRTLDSLNVVSQDDDSGKLSIYTQNQLQLEAPVAALMFSGRAARDATAFTQFFSDTLRRLEVDKQTKNLDVAVELLDLAVSTWRNTIPFHHFQYAVPENTTLEICLTERNTPIVMDLFFTEKMSVQ